MRPNAGGPGGASRTAIKLSANPIEPIVAGAYRASNSMLDTALAWHDAGAIVVPITTDGTKRPGYGNQPHAWSRYRQQPPHRRQLEWWFREGYPGLGVLTGDVSGGIEMAELEGRAVTEGGLDKLWQAAKQLGVNDLLAKVVLGYSERTPSGGLHLIYRVSGPVPGNTKLAARYALCSEVTDAEMAALWDKGRHPVRGLAETRGTGGYVAVAPSHGPVHATGRPWTMVSGGPDRIVTATPTERDKLLDAFRALNRIQTPEAAPVVPPAPKTAPRPVQRAGGANLRLSPGDDFEARVDWSDPLLLGGIGWRQVDKVGGVRMWRHPAANHEHSASTGRDSHHDRLFVFSTSTVFDAEKPYSKLRAYATIRGVDLREATRELRRLGYGGAR